MRALNSRRDHSAASAVTCNDDDPVVAEEASDLPRQSAPPYEPQVHREEYHFVAPAQERPPLAPFPRIAGPAPKVIQFPRNQTVARSYELAEPVSDQLRIFEAIEELPPSAPTHLSEIEIAPEEPTHTGPADLDLPLQPARLSHRAYAAAVDGLLLVAAFGIFAECAKFFANNFILNKSLLADGSVCAFVLLGMYFFLSLSYTGGTVGMRASGLWLSTFSGKAPSRNLLRWRALAILLSYATLGMGFAWAFIDEDRLCWHDRITRTHLRSEDSNKP